MPIRFSRVIFIVLILLYTGCSSKRREEIILTATPFLLTMTATATQSPALSETATSFPAQPTVPRIPPVEGMTSTQINVRAGPSTASDVLGIISANTRVEIIGKDPGGNWWQITYSAGVDGKGWVTAQYITTTATPEVPIIGGDETNPNHASVAIIQQQINVRSGPGASFNSLGTLNPQDVVSLTGKDSNGLWLQIDFPEGAGPEGKGWVNAAFVQAQGAEDLPIITETGLIVGTGTPTGIPPTPTPTLIPAWEDQDSADSPIASVIFESTGTQTFIYNGDLSSPEGDSEDWISFRPYGTFVFASLVCKGSDSLKIEITENNLPLNLELACGDQVKPVVVKADSNYLIHLQAQPSAGNLQYTNYILTIKMRPQ